MFIEEVGPSEFNSIEKVQKRVTKRAGEVKQAKGDGVEISKASGFQSLMRKTIEDSPDIDLAKVNKLQTQIAENRYNVSGKAIADKIIDSEEYNDIRNQFFA